MKIQFYPLSLWLIALSACQAPYDPHAVEAAYQPRQYIAYRSPEPLVIDGIPGEAAWKQAPYTEWFEDIEGDLRPQPRHRTRAKMLWDDEFLYFAAELEEPHLWATLTERESIIFHDNDFEVFIDPDGDTHDYYELEINALGTEWDLMLNRPYRDKGKANHAWNIEGLKTAVQCYGTLNDPSDTDSMWTLEIAMPWAAITAHAPGQRRPVAGEQWRVNFSRVQWQLDTVAGAYQKRIDPGTGKPFAEDNWVWSPQGIINMHAPESWGFVQFSEKMAGEGETEFVENPDEQVKWLLREVYLAQRAYHEVQGAFAPAVEQLPIREEIREWMAKWLALTLTETGYRATLPGLTCETWQIRADGRVNCQTPAPAEQIVVLTYNIHHGEGMDGRIDLPRIAAVIRAAAPDLVALQEVDSLTARSGGIDQAASLAALTGMYATYGPAFAFDGGKYGNAVLSKWKPEAVACTALPGEPRALLHLTFRLPDSETPLHFYATHLDTDSLPRRAAVPLIAAALPPDPAAACILAGDLNALPESPTLRALREHWEMPHPETPLPTFPVDVPMRQIDYVLFRPAARWSVVSATVLAESVASDHRPLRVVLEMRK